MPILILMLAMLVRSPHPANVQVLLTNRCKLTVPEIERFWHCAIHQAAEVNTAAENVPDPNLFLVELPSDFPCEDDDEGIGRCMGFFVRSDPMLVLFSHKDHQALEHEFLHMVLWQIGDRRWRCAGHRPDWQRGCFP